MVTATICGCIFSFTLGKVNNTDTHAKTPQWVKCGNPTALNTPEVTKNEIILKNKQTSS